MAEDKDLIFPMKLEIDVKNFEVDWKKIEPKLQAVLDKNPLKARIDIDEAKLKNAIAQLSKLNAVNGVPKQSTQAAMLTAQTRSRIMLEEQLARARERGTIAVEKQRIATANAEKAELNLERAKQRGIAAVHTQNKAYQAQRGILNGIPQFVNSYVSILGAYRLGQNIVDTTAEFEMQRVALAAIIQDKQKADQLFSQNVELGLQSPFQIKELITYTKQLAAFRIETDQLFDTTKRLADVSAGLGVDMGRLILAYGQVKAASVLRGQEVRQFTEAGIPIIQLLADKFTKLNNVATSTADVFKLISERGVSFGMVKEVFEDMTNAGGVFYNMQAIQAETLKGSLSNLTDAYQKMFMEIGNENMGMMKDTINGIRKLMENWELVAAAITPLAMSIITYSTVQKLSNAATTRATLLHNILGITIAKETVEMRLLTKAEGLATAGKVMSARATVSAAMANNVLTRSFYLLKAAIAANPIGFWVTAITTAIVGIWSLVSSIRSLKSDSEKLTKSLTDSINEIQAQSQLTTMSLDIMLKKLKSATYGSQEYADIVKRINELGKDHLKTNIDTASSYDEVKKAVDGVTESLKAAAKAKAYEAGMNIIETDYTSKLTEAYQKIQKGLTGKGFTKSQALAVTQYVSGEIAQDPSKYKEWSELHKLMVETVALAAKNANMVSDVILDFNDLSDDNLGYLIAGFRGLQKAQEGSAVATEEFRQLLNKSMGTVSGYELEVEKINKTYDSTAKKIKNAAQNFNSMGQPISYTTALFEAQRIKLESLLTLYEKVGNFNMWQKTSQELDKLTAKGNDWETLVDKMTRGEGNAVIGTLGIGSSKYARNVNGDEKESYLEYVKRLQDEFEKLTSAQSELSKNPKAIIPGLDKENIEKDIKNVKALASALNWTLEAKKTTGRTTDPRIAALKGQLDLVVDAYQAYLKRIKQVGAEQAKSDVEGLYGGQNAEIKGITSGLPLAFTPEELNAVIEQAKKGFGTLGKDAMATLRGVILKQNDENFEDLSRNFKENLDRLANEIEQTQRANEFYEKMLGLTGSAEMAKRLTEAMGMTVGDVREGMYSALRQIMGAAGDGVNLYDVNAVNKAISGLPETIRKAAQGQLAEIIDYEQKQLAEIYSGLEDYMTAQEKKVKIAAETQRRIAQIEGDKNHTPEEKAKLINLQERGLKQEYGKIDLEELKKTERFVKAFEDLDRVGDKTLTMLRDDLARLAKTADDPTALKTITDQIQKIDELLEGRKPFSSMVQGLNDYRVALNEVSKIGTEFADNSEDAALAQDKLKAAIDKVQSSAKKMKSDFDEASGAIQSVINFSQTLADTLGLSFSDETNEYIKAFTGGIEVASSAMSVMTAVTLALDAAMAPLLIAAAAIGLLFVGVSAATNLINASTENNIRNNADAIDVLSKSISKLNKSLDKSLGSEYVKNIQEQIRRKQEQIALEQEQIELNEELAETRANGWWLLGGLAAYGIAWLAAKKKEKEATAAIEKSQQEIDKLQDEIEMLERTLMQETTGYPSVTDAASDFANAWLDAYMSFENTTDAIGEKFKDMVQNMIVQSILASAVEAKLRPVFRAIEQAYEDGKMTVDELRNIQNLSTNVTIGLDADLSSLMAGLEAGGISVRASDRSLTGISASVAAMSEDTANTFGGYLNMGLMQWVQQTSLQTQILASVKEHDLRTPMANLFELQQQSLAAINGIKSDTAKLVLSNAEIVSTMKSVLNGTGTKGLNVYLKN